MSGTQLSRIANSTLDECGSTNDLAKELARAGYPSGTWVSARRQTQGRGRIGRSWESLEGNLHLSVLLRPKRTDLLGWLPIAAGTASTQAILQLLPGTDIRLKWPNDLWLGIDGAKVGGILCEGTTGPSGTSVIVGIGINCVSAPMLAEQKTATLAADIAPRLIPLLIQELLDRATDLDRGDSQIIREQYERISVLAPGTEISWGLPTGKAPAATENRGQVIGLGPLGQMIVETALNRRIELYGEEVTLLKA